MNKKKWRYISEGGKGIGGIQVYVSYNGKLELLKHWKRHSLTGFQMGYNGSGPADLARSMLIDYFIRDGLSSVEAFKDVESLYQQFKFDIISNQEKVLKVTKKEIEEWIEKNKD